MHMQPMYRMNPFVVCDGNGRARTNAYIDGGCLDVGMDIFERGLCLPSDNKMTVEEQRKIIEAAVDKITEQRNDWNRRDAIFSGKNMGHGIRSSGVP